MDTLNKIYNIYRTTDELRPRVAGKLKALDNIIKTNLIESENHNKDFIINLLNILIEYCDETDYYEFMANIKVAFSKTLRILKITNFGRNGKCVCGAKPVNMSRHLITKKHKKFVETNTAAKQPEPNIKLEYIPFTYNIAKPTDINPDIIPYSKMEKVEIWDDTASSTWLFGIYRGNIYNRNKIHCGIYRNYRDSNVPAEFKDDSGDIVDLYDRKIVEYILNESGMFYSLFSKTTFKPFYFSTEKERMIRSSDDIKLL